MAIVTETPATRLRVRRVEEHSLAEHTLARARKHNRVAVSVRHGGSVANSYGYPAETEGAVAIAAPDGRVWVGVERLPANKVTLSGVVSAVLGGQSPWRARFDDRYSVETWEIARPHALREAAALLDRATA